VGARQVKRPPLYTLLERTGFRFFYSRLYRIELRGHDRIPTEGGVILVANHESLIDPWLLGLATRRPIRYMAKAEVFEIPLLRRVMQWFGTFPVERGAGDRGAVGRAAQLLHEGQVLGIFPQGTCLPYRTRPWHRGAAKLALSTGAPIVPVAIIGSERALRPGKFRIGLPRIRIFVGEPIHVERARATIAAAKELTERLEHAVNELRGEFGPPAHAWFPEPTGV
jgi:1-acyl-sn-glycerol-3-phosphate acyltransferase